MIRYESQTKIKDLQNEIERLSRLYDYEIGKQVKFEERLLTLKQIAEEKQIESAALKYEYRKVIEHKENLQSENAYLKSLLASAAAATSSASPQKYLIAQQHQPSSSNTSSPSSSLSSSDMRRNLSGAAIINSSLNISSQFQGWIFNINLNILLNESLYPIFTL